MERLLEGLANEGSQADCLGSMCGPRGGACHQGRQRPGAYPRSHAVWDDFPDMHGPCREGLKGHLPIIQLVLDGGGESDLAARALERDLTTGEKAKATGKHGGDTAQVSREYLPQEECAMGDGQRKLARRLQILGCCLARSKIE
jgi:hypothetical protein